MKRNYDLARMLVQISGIMSFVIGGVLAGLAVYGLIAAGFTFAIYSVTVYVLALFPLMFAAAFFGMGKVIYEKKNKHDEYFYENRTKYLITGIVFLVLSGVNILSLGVGAPLVFIYIMMETGEDESTTNSVDSNEGSNDDLLSAEDNKPKGNDISSIISLKEAIDFRERKLLTEEEFQEIKNHYFKKAEKGE